MTSRHPRRSLKRLLIVSAAAAGAAAVALPAIAGLSSNPSFSHKLPVHVPSQAQVVEFDDDGRAARTTAPSPDGDRDSSRDDREGDRSHTPEPGDDRAGSRTSEPGDDRGSAPEAGDDSGGHGGGPGPGH